MKNGLVKLNTIEVQGWPLTVIDDEPRVAATLLGERLGYGEHAGKRTRELVRRLEQDGELGSVYMGRESRPISKPNGGTEFREVDEPYLTEVQAIILVMHVRTSTAKVLRQEIARVFVEAHRLRRQPSPSLDLSAAVVELRHEVQALREFVTRPAQQEACVGRLGAKEITAALQLVAELKLSCLPESARSAKLLRSFRSEAHMELRGHIAFNGSGTTFSRLTFEQFGRAKVKLSEMAARHRKLAGIVECSRQLPLANVRQLSIVGTEADRA